MKDVKFKSIKLAVTFEGSVGKEESETMIKAVQEMASAMADKDPEGIEIEWSLTPEGKRSIL